MPFREVYLPEDQSANRKHLFQQTVHFGNLSCLVFVLREVGQPWFL
jgi:hypothetical protein